MYLLFSKCTFLTSEEIIYRYQNVKIPFPLSIILGLSTTCTKPMQIYMDFGVSLFRFKYPATLTLY